MLANVNRALPPPSPAKDSNIAIPRAAPSIGFVPVPTYIACDSVSNKTLPGMKTMVQLLETIGDKLTSGNPKIMCSTPYIPQRHLVKVANIVRFEPKRMTSKTQVSLGYVPNI